MTRPVEVIAGNKIERHILRRAGGMQGRLFDPDIKANPENVTRHAEVWRDDVSYLFPGDDRVRWNTYTGELFLRSSRQRKGEQVIRWSKPLDLENGIRMAGRVSESYDPKTGKEMLKIKDAIQLIKGLSQSFQKPGLRSLEMDAFAKEAVDRLSQLGFVSAVNAEKQKIAEQILKAGSRDVLNRVNPARSRLILSNVWVDLIHELLVGKVTENKYASVGAKLTREREFERFVLAQVTSHIEGLLRTPTSFEDKKNIQDFKVFVRQYLGNDVVRLKPYAKIAAVTRFLVMNTGTKAEHDLLKKYIGEEAEMYYGTKPFTELSQKEREARLKGIRFIIQEELELAEILLHTKTEDRARVIEEHKKGVV